MGLFDDERYTPIVLSEAGIKAVRPLVEKFVAENEGSTDNEKRRRLPRLTSRRAIHKCVVYVLRNRPKEVKTVDGHCIEPILREIVAAHQAALPPLPEPEMEPIAEEPTDAVAKI